MRRRRFLELTSAAAAWTAAGGLAGALASCRGRPGPTRPAKRRVVVLGVGGMDAAFVERLMAAGDLPHLAALAAAGTFAPLRTTTPAEAEVAWATFATGMRPGKHGVWGKFGREPETYRTKVADLVLEPGRYVRGITVRPPHYRSLLCGEPFWRYGAAEGITTAALWAPADFPPEDTTAGVFLSGLGVPGGCLDAGVYRYFASDADFPRRETAAGGVWRPLDVRAGVARAELEPPPFAAGPPLEVTFRAEAAQYLNISVAGQEQRVALGNYSGYFTFPFGGGPFSRWRAVGRFFVVSVRPQMRVYLTPLDVDPRAAVVPVAAPADFGAALAADGPFQTRGRPLDFSGLYDKVLGSGPFAGQYYTQAEEKQRLGLATWRNRRPDLFLLFDYGLDALAHAYWRFYDPGHPAYDAGRFYSYADTLEDAYRNVDRLIGNLLTSPDAGDTALFVVSAHGNRPFRRAFDVNRWLYENGYLKLKEGARPVGRGVPAPEAVLRRGKYKAAVAWPETVAYALGYGAIYLNVAGREKRGVVAASEVARVKDELRERLRAVRDGGRRPVVGVHDGARLFAGPRAFAAPDLILSLADGYRMSWESVLGGIAAATFADNAGVWSGGHASVAAAAVPGLIFSNLKLETADAGVEDVAATVLTVLGLPVPGGYDGRPLAGS